jgi:DNA-binding transcriptional MerR regulator
MEYTIKELAELAGISTRTLRYYDEIELLPPLRVTAAGYRLYGKGQVDRLQQILFYRALGLELMEIKTALDDPAFCRLAALEEHLAGLREKRNALDRLIATVERTISTEKGESTMSDAEKFEGFKKKMLQENEETYGTEIRERFGDRAMEESNAKMLKLTQAEYERMQDIGREINKRLADAVLKGLSPEGPEGLEIAALHKRWLGFMWPRYEREAHVALAEGYVSDPRFTVYYDADQPGCAVFLRDAIRFHIQVI